MADPIVAVDDVFIARALRATGRIDKFVEDDGPARGARRFRVVTGGGLEVDVHPDRGLDLGHVTIDGIPVAFVEPGGVPSPGQFGTQDDGWLDAFGGGLLVTCGLDTYGAPSIDNGRPYPQHGRYSGIPAAVARAGAMDDRLVIEGMVRQAAIGGQRLLLNRRIEFTLGGTDIRLTDTVTNESEVTATEHMILYHFNFGWPLLEPGVDLQMPPSIPEPRDATSAAGLANHKVVEAPDRHDQAEVYLHEFPGQESVRVALRNDRRGLEAALTFDGVELPYMCQWKYLSYDAYVMGLEPMNTRTVTSRADAREKGVLRILQPQESVTYRISIDFRRFD